MKRIVTVGMVFFSLLGIRSLISASELMSSADLLDAGSWSLNVYGKSVKEKPVVETSGTEAIQVPTQSGNTTIFSDANAEIEMDSEHKALVAALTFRPHDGLHYRAKIGQVRDYKLEFASGSQTNALRAESDGLLWGFGLRWNASQDTLVSAAVAIDISYTQTLINFDRFQAGSTVSSISQRFEQEEFQLGVNISRRWKKVEPYGGLKIRRLVSRLKDKNTKEQIRGETDEFNPFVGLAWLIFDKEKLMIEASFLDEQSITAGFQMNF